ncbi:uncharacterized protein LOC114657050 [Erpetoichthys calabaricus]|uniref:uncharacterized protein LOC114657050 n=1 Tax=Erpetoichthys calabaricus TaxID=27687 RepID=UPI0010A020D2|nr:uncharacterized protein LOC114657050 [Erpetoichthys calabaricus]XP_028664624.1 uncharacterized protein LOC114657050 [Erpetoichthys calabaricus]
MDLLGLDSKIEGILEIWKVKDEEGTQKNSGMEEPWCLPAEWKVNSLHGNEGKAQPEEADELISYSSHEESDLSPSSKSEDRRNDENVLTSSRAQAEVAERKQERCRGRHWESESNGLQSLAALKGMIERKREEEQHIREGRQRERRESLQRAWTREAMRNCSLEGSNFLCGPGKEMHSLQTSSENWIRGYPAECIDVRGAEESSLQSLAALDCMIKQKEEEEQQIRDEKRQQRLDAQPDVRISESSPHVEHRLAARALHDNGTARIHSDSVEGPQSTSQDSECCTKYLKPQFGEANVDVLPPGSLSLLKLEEMLIQQEAEFSFYGIYGKAGFRKSMEVSRRSDDFTVVLQNAAKDVNSTNFIGRCTDNDSYENTCTLLSDRLRSTRTTGNVCEHPEDLMASKVNAEVSLLSHSSAQSSSANEETSGDSDVRLSSPSGDDRGNGLSSQIVISSPKCSIEDTCKGSLQENSVGQKRNVHNVLYENNLLGGALKTKDSSQRLSESSSPTSNASFDSDIIFVKSQKPPTTPCNDDVLFGNEASRGKKEKNVTESGDFIITDKHRTPPRSNSVEQDDDVICITHPTDGTASQKEAPSCMLSFEEVIIVSSQEKSKVHGRSNPSDARDDGNKSRDKNITIPCVSPEDHHNSQRRPEKSVEDCKESDSQQRPDGICDLDVTRREEQGNTALPEASSSLVCCVNESSTKDYSVLKKHSVQNAEECQEKMEANMRPCDALLITTINERHNAASCEKKDLSHKVSLAYGQPVEGPLGVEKSMCQKKAGVWVNINALSQGDHAEAQPDVSSQVEEAIKVKVCHTLTPEVMSQNDLKSKRVSADCVSQEFSTVDVQRASSSDDKPPAFMLDSAGPQESSSGSTGDCKDAVSGQNKNTRLQKGVQAYGMALRSDLQSKRQQLQGNSARLERTVDLPFPVLKSVTSAPPANRPTSACAPENCILSLKKYVNNFGLQAHRTEPMAINSSAAKVCQTSATSEVACGKLPVLWKQNWDGFRQSGYDHQASSGEDPTVPSAVEVVTSAPAISSERTRLFRKRLSSEDKNQEAIPALAKRNCTIDRNLDVWGSMPAGTPELNKRHDVKEKSNVQPEVSPDPRELAVGARMWEDESDQVVALSKKPTFDKSTMCALLDIKPQALYDLSGQADENKQERGGRVKDVGLSGSGAPQERSEAQENIRGPRTFNSGDVKVKSGPLVISDETEGVASSKHLPGRIRSSGRSTHDDLKHSQRQQICVKGTESDSKEEPKECGMSPSAPLLGPSSLQKLTDMLTRQGWDVPGSVNRASRQDTLQYSGSRVSPPCWRGGYVWNTSPIMAEQPSSRTRSPQLSRCKGVQEPWFKTSPATKDLPSPGDWQSQCSDTGAARQAVRLHLSSGAGLRIRMAQGPEVEVVMPEGAELTIDLPPTQTDAMVDAIKLQENPMPLQRSWARDHRMKQDKAVE